MVSPLPPAPTPPSANTANLLNLLKFSGQGSGGQPRTQDQQSSGSSSAAIQMSPRGLRDEPGMMQSSGAPSMPRILQPAPVSQDPSGLLAALMRGHHEPEEPHQEPKPAAPTSSFNAATPPADTRQYLLNLLNRPKPSQNDVPPLSETSRSTNVSPGSGELGGSTTKLYNLDDVSGFTGGDSFPPISHAPSNNVFNPTSFDQPMSYNYPSNQDGTAAVAPWIFGKQFDNVSQHSPQERTSAAPPLPDHLALAQHDDYSTGTPQFQILKKPQSASSSSHFAAEYQRHGSHHGSHQDSDRNINDSPGQSRRHVELNSSVNAVPTPPTNNSYPGIQNASEKHRESVSEAINDLAEQADREAQEALARAEQEQADKEIARDIQDMLRAQTEKGFQESAILAAQGIKKELDRDENSGLLEETLPPQIAEQVRHIVDDTAQGIADSWESADADEIIVVEEENRVPIKVYNFPMKPWISIHMQETEDEPRPMFPDDTSTITDIARLKKEFDQIDRNLFTATQNYMVYGMSKAGGLRVIRQEDGRDAKIFTETRDRIFNLSMSVTPEDHSGVHREAIIGTGISGTVYWIQIKDGEKDHIEDAHPEQYGFALPPITSQEGDTPGGVLKTRARPSMIHPEYFAVGRGKSINIIWPAYIMSQNLFKPGHDRVVDTERLAKQCSLKINTGKAGKDFTFSQDDTLIVSLDKSGRVKFWDVRDLTAIKDGSDPRCPVPAQTSLEIQMPLMTLNSTPEGEKAWPTSVLLLDKFRPYQRRCALRYMIVGMKQNHTLQLWDLALGKPVQEFHLPHSKESDAVCSFMYHPQTGMLIIGHPTRNSIYLAHLSAPKYNLKSISQVEYIQRLAAQDPSIPQPDSTAVISGVREYSFENRGVLRSLDLLGNPAMVHDSNESTLFELYAMHSKGVACIFVKQADLGWSKDNKVLHPEDAVVAGVATIGKLKNPAPLGPGEAIHQPQAQAEAPSRQFPKESLLQTTPSQDDTTPRSGPESANLVKLGDMKEDETPVRANQAATVTDKGDKKGRKKKTSPADPSSNGSTNSARATPSSAKPGEISKTLPSPPAVLPSTLSQETMESAVAAVEARLASNIGGVLDKEMKSLLGKINESLQTRDVDFDTRQMNLLNLVSAVLNENTQKVLGNIIQEQFANTVVPTISEVAAKAVLDQLKGNLTAHIAHTMQKEIQKGLPAATQHALHNNEFVTAVSDRVAASVTASVQKDLLTNIVARINTTITTVAAQASQRGAADMQQHYQEEFKRLHTLRLADGSKIDQLLSLVNRLSESVSNMEAVYSRFQGDFVKFQQQATRERPSAPEYPTSLQSQLQSQIRSQVGDHIQSPPHSNQMAPSHHAALSHAALSQAALSQAALSQVALSQVASSQHPGLTHNQSQLTNLSRAPPGPGSGVGERPDANPNAVAQLVQSIQASIQANKFDEAMLQWLQSGREKEVFDLYLHKISPIFVRDLPPLLLLSITATLSVQMDGSLVREKVSWLEIVVHCIYSVINSVDEQTRQVTPKIMALLIERAESTYMRISSSSASEPLLKNLSQMVTVAKRVMELCRGSTGSHFESSLGA